MLASTLDLERSASSITALPETLVNSPRTVEMTMCRTANEVTEWEPSSW